MQNSCLTWKKEFTRWTPVKSLMIVRKGIFGFLLLDRAHVWIGLYLPPVKFRFHNEVLFPHESSFKGFILRLWIWGCRISPMELPTEIPRLDLSLPSRSADWSILMLRSFLIPGKVDTVWLSVWSIQWLHSKKSLSPTKIFHRVLSPQ